MNGKPIFDDIANLYDKWFETPLGKKIFESEKRAIENLIEEGNGKVALDLGIGTGLFTQILREKGYKVIGIDISEEMLKIAKKRGFEVIKHDFNYPLPFEKESFDFVFSMTSIEFLLDPKPLFNEVKRILKKDGKFLLITLNSLSLWALKRRIEGLFDKNNLFNKARFYSPSSLKKFFKEGWKILRCESKTFIPPWNPLFPSFWENIFSKIFPSFGAISIILIKKKI
ncbi:MAG: methyltransferase domain-containing protein [Caldisericia bacterium]|jgi:ubiquinone/menaquinone biosynthesis C-methylase UbiE|nr:methyltransferase domain-containing protein [Caldisericia bacterium]